MRAAAIQMEAALGDLDLNLEQAETLAEEAASAGAEIIALPEFFTTGIGFDPKLADAGLAPDGAATELLLDLARRHGAIVGGSFLCRDADDEVRNAYLLATPDGIAGRHDKDLPTMWENSLYIGGDDDGVIDAGELTFGAAVCWELMRTQTVRRLAGRIDLAIGGSGWWSMLEDLPPAALWDRAERGNAATARRAIREFSAYVGAPFVHGAHTGPLECEMPWAPFRYRGHFQGGAAICDADGTILAWRDRADGPGHAIAEVTPRRVAPRTPPDRFWLHRRGLISAFAWEYQKLHGRPWYREHVSGRPAAKVSRPQAKAAA